MPRLLEEWRMKGLESSMAAMVMGEKKELIRYPKGFLKKWFIRGWSTQLYKNLIINDIHDHEREKKKNQLGIRKVPLKNDA